MKKTNFAILFLVAAWALVSCTGTPTGTSSMTVPRTSTVSKEIESPVVGTAEAKVSVKIFSDFQCPACQRIHDLIEPKLKEYATSGKISITYKNYPLPQHQNAEGDALASLCALSVGKYSEYADAMYALEKAKLNADVSDAERIEIAKNVGITDLDQFGKCLSEGWYMGRVAIDKKEGDRLELDHTPSVYFNDKIVDFKSVDEFFAILDATVGAAK